MAGWEQFRRRPQANQVTAILVADENVDVLVDTEHVRVFTDSEGRTIRSVEVDTGHGRATAELGDYVMRDSRGAIYPCEASVFADTYEPIE